MSAKRSDSSPEQAVGIALLVVGAIVLVIKVVPAITLHAVLKLWPLALVWIGWRMIRDDEAEDAT